MESKFTEDNNSHISIAEVIECLEDIAELELDAEIINKPFVKLSPFSNRKIDWIHGDSNDTALNFSREVFSVILNYLQSYYKNKESYDVNSPAMEHIKTIMAVVGEAAKKLDKYSALFQKQKSNSITGLAEFKKLQEFYQKRIAHQVDDITLGKWVMVLANLKNEQKNLTSLPNKEFAAPVLDKVFVDLESVKNDSEYELFFIRKADGGRFFEPHLLRNIKLMSDFAARGEGEDPLADMPIWEDHLCHEAAKSIYASIDDLVDQFYQQTFKNNKKEFVEILNKALMALMLCCDPHNQMREFQIKSSGHYFQDFRNFMNELLHTDDYQRYVAYPPKDIDSREGLLYNLTNAICEAFYTSIRRYQAFGGELAKLLNIAHLSRSREHTEGLTKFEIGKRIANDYAAMLKLFKRHPSGYFEKVLQALYKDKCRTYDPMSQMNLPNNLYKIQFGGHYISCLHLPSPTTQEYIDKVCVLDEFRAFLRSYYNDSPKQKHLLINLQDRTSWKEYFRCNALESLVGHTDFDDSLAVVTIPKETDFYEQLAPYDLDNHAESFLSHFKEHIGSENSGYYFNPQYMEEIIHEFTPAAIQLIHKMFFSNKNILLKEHRLDFIEIFDLFLILKLIDLTQPSSFSLTCKDCVDKGASSNALLYIFMKMVQPEPLSTTDWDHINMLIYTPSILVRERIMSSARFNRFLGAIKILEFLYQELGAENFGKAIRDSFGPLYKTKILDGVVLSD